MRMEVHLQQRLEQRMHLSQQMLQNLELLQLPLMELRALIVNELQENPTHEARQDVEEREPTSSDPVGEETQTETPEETALKEAQEEAGIHGVILPDPVASYDDHKWRAECVVQLYLLRYAEDCRSWEEKHLRERRWCGYEDALRLIKKPKIRSVLEKARERLDRERAF